MSQIVFSSKFIVPDTTLIQESSGEAVILGLASESYYGLNSVGTRMWNALINADSIQEAYDKLSAEFDVDQTTLRSDMEAFIADLIESQLIQISGHD